MQIIWDKKQEKGCKNGFLAENDRGWYFRLFKKNHGVTEDTTRSVLRDSVVYFDLRRERRKNRTSVIIRKNSFHPFSHPSTFPKALRFVFKNRP
jgi:hypothetical protein